MAKVQAWADDRSAFLEAVRGYAPSKTKAYAVALDDLIGWTCLQGDDLRFVARDGDQSIVKFCVPGVDTPFWAAYPRKVDGAKLTVFPEPHASIPEDVREMARQRLAEMEGDDPAPNSQPMVSFRVLEDCTVRERVKELFQEMLRRLATRNSGEGTAERGAAPDRPRD
jgi:hypothetical protein